MSIMTDLQDNPIFVKHLRVRLRRQHLLPLIIVVGAICIVLTFGGLSALKDDNRYLWHVMMALFFIMQGCILFAGMAQVTTSVSQARENGMMDFHRVSPQSPQRLVLGFLIGAPVREYLLFGVTLPFYLLLIAPYVTKYPGFWLLPLVLLVLSLLYNLLALLVGLSYDRLQLRNAAGGVVGLTMLCQGFCWFPALSHLTIVSPIVSVLSSSSDFPPIAITFFGWPFPPLLLALLHQIPLCLFLWIAVVRKMRRESAFSYTRPVAVAFFMVLGFLLTGDLAIILLNGYSRDTAESFGPGILLYALSVLAIGFIATATPRLSRIVRGMRYTHKIGLPAMSYWSSYAVNWPFVVALAGLTGLFASGAIFLANSAGRFSTSPLSSFFAIGTAVLTVSGFGFGLQSFHLLNRKHGTIFFTLCLFFLWFMPIIVGITDPGSRFGQTIMSISPITGIGMAYFEDRTWAPHDTYGSIAFSAALLSTVIFGLLYRSAVRRIDAEVQAPRERIVPAVPSAAG